MSEMIRTAVADYADRVAIIDADSGAQYSYAEFGLMVGALCQTFDESGLRPGDHVALCARNGVMWAAVEAAVACSGMTLAPLSIYLSAAELTWVLGDCRANALVFDTDQRETVAAATSAGAEAGSVVGQLAAGNRCLMIPPGATTDDEWPASLPSIAQLLSSQPPALPRLAAAPGGTYRILYTSATTGVPKGVACDNDVNVAMIMSTLANQLRALQDADRLIVTTPLTHVAGMFFWPFFVSGHTSILMSRYQPEEFCRLAIRHDASHAVMAPTLVADLVNSLERHPDTGLELAAGRLRAIWYAGSPIPDSVADNAIRLLGPIIYQQYGLTEMLSGYPSSGATVLTPEMHLAKRGSCGRPYPGVVLRIVDESGVEVGAGEEGEVAVLLQAGKGRYWSLPEGAVSAYRDGWLLTGDTGYLDKDGFLFLRDRKSDMIVSGGLNVYPTEVESALLEHPAVDACAVIGIPHPRWVEQPVAVVVRSAGADVSGDELIEYARSRIAHYKAPKEVYFSDSLPVSANGKLLRRELRQQYRNGRS
jgi:acyl-CoA synthetase (AMP-forming)/AMP-acid ligase II